MALVVNLLPVERRVLRHEVLQGLRSGILSGEIAPGTRLLEVPLANELGVSRGPVREALRQLEQEGLVEFYPHRGAVVVGVADAEVETIYGIRALLEGRAFARACRVVTDEELEALAATVEKMISASEAGDVAAVTEHDMRFHGRVVEISGSSTCAGCGRASTVSSDRARQQRRAIRLSNPRGSRLAGRAIAGASRARRRAAQPRPAAAAKEARPPHHVARWRGSTTRTPVIARAEVLVLSHRLSRHRLFSTGSNVTGIRSSCGWRTPRVWSAGARRTSCPARSRPAGR